MAALQVGRFAALQTWLNDRFSRTMTRPLLSSSIIDLERLFAASQHDPRVLSQLEEELRNRKTKRAVVLLGNVIRRRQQARSQGDEQARAEAEQRRQQQARAEAEQRRQQHQEQGNANNHSSNKQLRDVMRHRLTQPNGWQLVLELSGSFDLAMVRVAYRKMALRLHPDRGGDLELMQLLNQAMDMARKELEF